MDPLYAIRLGIASLRNVPWAGLRTAQANGRLIFANVLGVLIVTESWHPLTKAALRRAAPRSFRWFTAIGQSVMVGWDNDLYELVWKKRIKGGASPRIRRVCDRRDLFIVCLRDRKTGRCFVVIGVHTAPLPTKKAPDLVPVARLSHVHAGDNILEQVDSTGYPVAVAGDANVLELLPSNDLLVGPGITHAECWNGTNAKFRNGGVRTKPIHSDHPLVLITLEAVAA